MTTIWKFVLNTPMVAHITNLKVACLCDFLSVDMQDRQLCLWAQVDTEAELVEMQLEVYGTGHEILDHGMSVYIGTAFDGPFVWHVFERLYQ